MNKIKTNLPQNNFRTLLLQSIDSRYKAGLLSALVVLSILAFGMRFLDVNTPGIARDREYRSALIARAFYFEATDSVPEWKRDIALASKERAGVLEPPITELLVSLIYRLAKGEHLWLARLLTSGFWVTGGVFLFMVALRIMSFEAALLSTAYYLFVPLGVLASRTFYPDPLMIMMFLVSIFAILRYFIRSSSRRLILAAAISGLAILIKPLVLFALLSAFFSLAVLRESAKLSDRDVTFGDIFRKSESSFWPTILKELVENKTISKYSTILKRIIDRKLLTFILVSMLPAALYYGYGVFTSESLVRQAQGIFLPQLILLPEFWKQWLLTATGAVGVTPLAVGLIGLPLQYKGLPRALLVGLWFGYVIFCLVFTYHIRFAAGYHLQLIVIAALSFGPVSALIISHLRQSSESRYWWVSVFGVFIIAILFNMREVRGQLANYQLLESEEIAQKVGEIVGHSDEVVYIAYHYGMPFEYYGELSGSYWPRSISDTDQASGVNRVRSVEERINALGFSPEYFVVTDFTEFYNHHTDLREYLSNNCSLLVDSDQYLIYEKCGK